MLLTDLASDQHCSCAALHNPAQAVPHLSALSISRLDNNPSVLQIAQLLLAEPKARAGKAQANSKQRTNNSRRKAAAQAEDKHGKHEQVVQQTQTSTEVATLPLDDSNVGNKMLKSMGWSEGTGLGTLAQGQVDPVPVIKRIKRRGVGA